MAGVREIVLVEEFDLDPGRTKNFCLRLPRKFVDEELDASRVIETWEEFLKVANVLLKGKRCCMGNKYWKRVAFSQGMEKICSEFSRRTENIKLEFLSRKPPKQKSRFKLRLTKLTSVDASLRNTRSIVAEIPAIQEEVPEATLLRLSVSPGSFPHEGEYASAEVVSCTAFNSMHGCSGQHRSVESTTIDYYHEADFSSTPLAFADRVDEESLED